MSDAQVSYRTVADLLGSSEATLRLHYDGRTDTGKRTAIGALERVWQEGIVERIQTLMPILRGSIGHLSPLLTNGEHRLRKPMLYPLSYEGVLPQAR
jgi:hypothetical protein